MDMIAYLDERFCEALAQIERLRAETSTRFEQLEDAVRQTQAMIESLRGDVRQVAAGLIATDESLRSLRKEITVPSDDLRALMQQSHSTLDTRIHRLESWRETRERDPIDIIRERWGRPAGPQT